MSIFIPALSIRKSTCDAQKTQFFFKLDGQTLCLPDVNEMKGDLISCSQLTSERQIIANNMSDPRIPAGGLLIGHQNYQLPVRQQLDRPKTDSRRYQFARLG
jgi:hypothetical protein